MHDIFEITKIGLNSFCQINSPISVRFRIVYGLIILAFVLILKYNYPYADAMQHIYISFFVSILLLLDSLFDWLKYARKINFHKEYKDVIFISFLRAFLVFSILLFWSLLQQGSDKIIGTICAIIILGWSTFLDYIVIKIGLKQGKIIREGQTRFLLESILK